MSALDDGPNRVALIPKPRHIAVCAFEYGRESQCFRWKKQHQPDAFGIAHGS